MEAHQVYTDIQYLISGSELIGHELRNNQPVINEYNPDKDIAFFEGNGMPLLLKPGLFAVFFPHDLHRPCMKIEQSEPIKKVVIKLKL
jgi:YhcH/YjgK/YiaL family protein